MIRVLIKFIEGQQLIIAGHLTPTEIQLYKQKGYKIQEYNKQNIIIQQKR